MDGIELVAENNDQPEWNQVLQNSLDRLDPKFRSVVVLRWIEGYSTRETADILKVPEGTILSRLSRAQKKLQHWLGPYYRNIPDPKGSNGEGGGSHLYVEDKLERPIYE